MSATTKLLGPMGNAAGTCSCFTGRPSCCLIMSGTAAVLEFYKTYSKRKPSWQRRKPWQRYVSTPRTPGSPWRRRRPVRMTHGGCCRKLCFSTVLVAARGFPAVVEKGSPERVNVTIFVVSEAFVTPRASEGCASIFGDPL